MAVLDELCEHRHCVVRGDNSCPCVLRGRDVGQGPRRLILQLGVAVRLEEFHEARHAAGLAGTPRGKGMRGEG